MPVYWSRSRKHNGMLAVLALIGLVCGQVHSQNITADVLDTVTDPSGAVVPGASVAIQNTETNAIWHTQTNASG